MKYKVPIMGKWFEVTDAELAAMRDNGQADVAGEVEHWIVETDKNPLGNFLAHGVAWSRAERVFGGGALYMPASTYPAEWKNDGVAFLNDWASGFVVLLAPNQVGKSKHMVAKTALAVLRCDAKWPVFKWNGVICPEWQGPKTWVVASYSWDNVGTLWKGIQETFPRYELGAYAPHWGKYEGEHGKQKDMNFGDGKPKHFDCAVSKSRLIFLCYTQMQMHWESFTSDGLSADEQAPEEKWVGWARSTRTRGICQSIHALTGHQLDDRPDTGAGGWFKREVWDGLNTRGRKVGRYHISIDSVPDAIISKAKKEEAWHEWADPATQRTAKQERAAVARYWGGWEIGAGAVFEEFQRAVHVIEPLWEDDKVPKHWTKWRVVDYGDNGVTCVLWFAVSPEGWAVCYRELYERGLVVAQTAAKVIERSQNTQRKCAGEEVDDVSGVRYSLFEERHMKPYSEHFYRGLLDSRSAAQNHQGPTLIQLFSRYGLELSEACGQRNEIQIPRLKDWLRVDFNRPHPWRKGPEGKSMMGAPLLYFFDGRCENTVRELEGLQNDPNDVSKINKKNDHHAVDCCKYWASDAPAYHGDMEWLDEEDKWGEDGQQDKHGGGNGERRFGGLY